MTDQTTDPNLTDQQQKEAPASPIPSRNIFNTASNTASKVFDTLSTLTPFRKQKVQEIRTLEESP